jgi:hypothetical protein
MLSTMTLSAPAIARTATGVADGPSSLSEDVRGFMVSIGRDRVVDYDVVLETYNYIGWALWETTVAARLDLNSGTAKGAHSVKYMDLVCDCKFDKHPMLSASGYSANCTEL